MKVAVLGTRGFPNVQGGVEKHCEALYPHLVRSGWDVTVFARSPYTGPASYRYSGVLILPIECPKHKFLEAFVHTLFGVFKAKQSKADILHIHGIGPCLFAPLARWLGLKVVMTHHGFDYERQKWNRVAKIVLKLGERWGVSQAHQVIAVSETIAGRIRRTFGREAAVIPNGVAFSGRVGENGVLERYGLTPGRYILAVGRLVPEKGFGDLIASFRRLSLAGYKLVIAGDADHEDAFSRRLKKESRMVPKVILTGFLETQSLRELYSHAALFVLPSYHEGLPIALLEALGAGALCLATDLPAVRDTGMDEARCFKPGDIDQMRKKIETFLRDPMSEAARRAQIQRIADRYDWKRIAKKTADVYRQINAAGI